MNTKKEVLDKQTVDKIRETREQKNLTQAEVALKAGVTVTFYAMMERGEANPSIAKLKRVLNALDLTFFVKKT